MDIPRDTRKPRRRRIIFAGVGALALLAVTLGLRRLKPAAPTVDRATLWIDVAKRGEMLRQVRGTGTLVPEVIRWIPAATDGRVEKILVLPGTAVKADTVILELSNPDVSLASQDAALQLKSAEADYISEKVKIEGQRLDQEASLATLEADYNQASRERDMNEKLFADGLVSNLVLENSRGKVKELAKRLDIEKKRLDMSADSVSAQLASQKTSVEKVQALAAVRRDQAAALKVRAGIDGILQQVPVEVGQRVAAGATLAKVAQPDKLKAELKIAETQAKDILAGQPADIDTRNGVVAGVVSRIDPAVQNGTVTVDVAIRGPLPKGARPDLSVDGTIQLEKLENVLSIGRPAFGQEQSTVGMFVLEPGGKFAQRVPVKLGRGSVNAVEVLGGLKAGDQAILSDMSRWDGFNRVRLE
ncbi:MAG TPA: HlyD family efflux transporter periplasmic adaptor subunit [Thermoanaerobaculia bacterium]|jgi:HlyD family secretion protein|nr:HlyD family efflux transporter periplasmic adaptor subunit [Thermoanaerobaculia bacterium]